MKNKNLHQAKRDKKDEFYTQLSDIENELKHYKKHFENKIIFCNCDDPIYSNFHRYFRINFNELKLKKLITTHFKADNQKSYALILTREMVEKNPKFIRLEPNLFNNEIEKYQLKNSLENGSYLGCNYFQIDPKKIPLKENGDFRSEEVIELLDEADVVVTNPPFSLLREYVAQLFKHNKKFLIVANINFVTCKEIFPLIKDNKMWLGYKNGPCKFLVPENYDRNNSYYERENKCKYAKFGNICWLTNLDIEKRHKLLPLYKTHNEKEFPKYDNYNAIEVRKVSEIPVDFNGVMGVPITFLYKHNPSQFKILNLDRYIDDNPCYGSRFKIDGKETYARVMIKYCGELK